VVQETLLHMHQAGASMKVQHVRGGVELQPLAELSSFDFNFQTGTPAPPAARLLLPGDELITTCTYNTVSCCGANKPPGRASGASQWVDAGRLKSALVSNSDILAGCNMRTFCHVKLQSRTTLVCTMPYVKRASAAETQAP